MSGYALQIWEKVPAEYRPLVILCAIVLLLIALFAWAAYTTEDGEHQFTI